MSNARNLSDLLGTGTTIATASIADDAITAAKIATDAVVADGLSSSAITSGDIASGDLPTGSILQVVYASTTSLANFSSTSFVDTNLSGSITPASTSNKILILVNQNGCRMTSVGTGSDGMKLRLLRGSTQIQVPVKEAAYPDSGQFEVATLSTAYVDSPSTTSATTYKTQMAMLIGAKAGQANANSVVSSMILAEIKG